MKVLKEMAVLVLVVVIFACLGFCGYVVYQKYFDKNTVVDSGTTVDTPVVTTKSVSNSVVIVDGFEAPLIVNVADKVVDNKEAVDNKEVVAEKSDNVALTSLKSFYSKYKIYIIVGCVMFGIAVVVSIASLFIKRGK